MQRAGLQRTCPQRPHGGFETLCLRSELKVRSCQWPQDQGPFPPVSPGLEHDGSFPKHTMTILALGW
ncbi:Sperm-Associated Antigen 1 [Manis pentadactyla]|nr:Sperm-Associated Antigen 1 [Manis pentadactyla]